MEFRNINRRDAIRVSTLINQPSNIDLKLFKN